MGMRLGRAGSSQTSTGDRQGDRSPPNRLRVPSDARRRQYLAAWFHVKRERRLAPDGARTLRSGDRLPRTLLIVCDRRPVYEDGRTPGSSNGAAGSGVFVQSGTSPAGVRADLMERLRSADGNSAANSRGRRVA